ncbi:MAG: hypothetical protein ACXWUG_00825 [Polyangiales bacterium]
MDVSLRVIAGTDRANVADAIRTYVAVRETLQRALGSVRVGDTYHAALALHFVRDLARPVVAERIAGAAGVAVYFCDRMTRTGAEVPSALRSVANDYLDAVVRLALASACFGGPGSAPLVRRVVAEFSMRADRYVTARAEQLGSRRRGVLRKAADANLRDALRHAISAAAVVSEVICLETDVVALA